MKNIVRQIKTTQPQNKNQSSRAKTSSSPAPGSSLEFCFSSAFHGLMVLLFVSRIWLTLVQLKPDNKTPQYELYLLSWVCLPLIGMAITRLIERFRTPTTSPLLYRRSFVFFNFILVLAAYWDVQTPAPWPLITWIALYLMTQALSWAVAAWSGRFAPLRRETLSAAIYLAMAVLFLSWLTQLVPGWKTRLLPWRFCNILFAAALAYAFLIDLNPKLPRLHLKVNSWIGNLILYSLAALLFAFLFIDPSCGYDIGNDRFFIGPLADFINGKTMLVDINAQYGVFLYFFLRLIFPGLLPLGFHSFYFLNAILWLAQYVIFFWIARQLFSSILYPLLGTVALILLNCDQIPNPLWYPSQGALRFGFIYGLTALVLLRSRYPLKAAQIIWLEAFTVAVAFFWSFEVCFYTVPPYLAFVAYETLFPEPLTAESIKKFLTRLVPAALGIALLAGFIYLFTWLRAGQLPHWEYYFDYVQMYGQGFGMIDTPLLGPWWIVVGILYFSLFWLLIPGEKKMPHKSVLVLAAFYGIFQLFYYFGRSIRTNLYPVLMPEIFLSLYWLYALRAKDFPQVPKFVQNAWLVLFLGLSLYAVQPIISTTQDLLDSQCRRMSPPRMVDQFLMAGRDLPRDQAFAKNAERLMEKYSGNQKFPVYFFGEKGIEIAMYDGRSKTYPYDDILQAVFLKPVRERVLSTRPDLKTGDYIYTSPDMDEPQALPGERLNLEQTLFNQLKSRFVLKPVETSGTITIYQVAGEKSALNDPSKSIQKIPEALNQRNSS